MKPPSSPKWLFIPFNSGGLRVNIPDKDQSGTVSFVSNQPQIFTVNVWKQSDVLRPNLLNNQVDADSTYTFFIEGNYTVNGVDFWSSLTINISAWYDNGAIGLASQPNDPTWNNSNYRTRQFNLTYSPSTGASMTYPLPIGAPSVREFFIANYWADPTPHGADGYTHYLYINVTFGPQTWAANGSGFLNGAATGGATWDKTLALNDAGSWDMQVHMYDSSNLLLFNTSYEEFGIKQYASIISSSNPGGSAPPGTNSYFLGVSTLHYTSNTQYFVTVSIPNLHMNGDLLNPKLIPATNLYVRSYHSLRTGYSNISNTTSFPGPNSPLNIWGVGPAPGTPITAPFHGTESAGPLYSDYTAAATATSFEVTTFGWWIDVPVSVSAGAYSGTITITISGTL